MYMVVRVRAVATSFMAFFQAVPVLPSGCRRAVGVPWAVDTFTRFFPGHPPAVCGGAAFAGGAGALDVMRVMRLDRAGRRWPRRGDRGPRPLALARAPSGASSGAPTVAGRRYHRDVPLVGSVTFSGVFFASSFMAPVSFGMLWTSLACPLV